MASSYYRSNFFSRAYDVISVVIVAIERYVLEALRFVGPLPFDLLQKTSINAYRVIGTLSPTYRESYDTHGLSLPRRRM